MSIVVIGVNHRTGPLAILERLTIHRDDLGKAVVGLVQRDNIREAAVLSTCGRTEVYIVAERFHGPTPTSSPSCATSARSRPTTSTRSCSRNTTMRRPGTSSKSPPASIRSVLGESEILGQVRTAGEVARASGGIRATLDLLFRHAVRIGKRARTETAIGRGTASISHAAVEMCADRLGGLTDRDVLVVGAGEMGGGVATALHHGRGRSHQGRQPHAVTRRRAGGAVGGEVVDFDSLAASIDASDVVVACASADQPLVNAALLTAARQSDAAPADRRHRRAAQRRSRRRRA